MAKSFLNDCFLPPPPKWSSYSLYHHYMYMDMISLKNVMENPLNDSITLFLYTILKLLCSDLCTFILFSYTNVWIELCGEPQMKTTVYEFMLARLDWSSTFLYFRSIFYTSVYNVEVKALVKIHGRFGVL